MLHKMANQRQKVSSRVGNGISFRKNSAEQTRNSFVIPRKKVLIPGHSDRRVYSETRNRRKWHEKNWYKKNPAPANRFDSIFCRSSELLSLPWNGSEQNSKCLQIFFSTERNSELFSPPQNGSDWNSERLHLILFHGKEFRAIFSSAERFDRNSENFLFRGTAGIPPKQTNCSVYSVFRGIIFLLEIANPSQLSPLPSPFPLLSFPICCFGNQQTDTNVLNQQYVIKPPYF